MENLEKYNSQTKDIAIAGIFSALMVVISLFFHYVIPPFVFGYSLEIDIFFLICGLIFIKHKSIRFMFIFISPFIRLLDMSFYFLNPLQFLIEYIFAIWVFGFCFFFRELIFKFKDKKIKIFLFSFTLFFLSYSLKLICHLIAGRFWWSASWIGSLIINSQIIGINFIVVLFLFVICSPIIYKMCLRIN